MNLSSLRYFHDVCSSGSIRKTSDRLGISPSTISRQILILEREVGTELLQRSAAGVIPTAAGEHVAAYARMVVLDYDTLRSDLDDLKGSGRALIKIAAIESVIAAAPMDVIAAFQARHPQVSFRSLSLTASAVAEAVRSGACDIGITYGLAPDPELLVAAQVDQSLVLAVPPGHPLALEPVIQVEHLRDLPLAVHEADHGIRRILDRACRAKGFTVSPVLTSSSLEVLREFVRRGLGAAVMTLGGVESDARRGEMVAVPIHEPAFDGRLVLIVRQGRRLSRIHRAFVDSLAEQLSRRAPHPSVRSPKTA
jgi:DNA-binding transcriptional LysR family regulator